MFAQITSEQFNALMQQLEGIKSDSAALRVSSLLILGVFLAFILFNGRGAR